MEREYSRNRNSFRSERNEGRYSRETEGNQEKKAAYGYKRERREERGSRYEGGNRHEGGSRYESGSRHEGGSRYEGGNKYEGGNRYERGRGREEGERRYSGGREQHHENRRSDYRERPSGFSGNRNASPYRERVQEGERRPLVKTLKRRSESAEGDRPNRPYRREEQGYDRNRDRRREGTGEREHSFRRPEGFRNRKSISEEEKEGLRKRHYSKKKILSHRLKQVDENAELRLNRYISMGGVCSRRDADELITTGRVKVNGEVVDTVGMKVRRSDRVEVDGVEVVPEKKVYLVLNKPKDYVTTVEDPLERKTVMSLIEGACKERIYPVGRLDRQTTGVLLFTNDGDLAKKLTHPKYNHKKIYHVFLDKPLEEKDRDAIAEGIELEDGFIKADEIEYVAPDRMEVGIEIHSGKNRIVRRIFEHLGYQIVKLDRVYFAGITKKNLPRGKWRFLNYKEVNMLKVY